MKYKSIKFGEIYFVEEFLVPEDSAMAEDSRVWYKVVSNTDKSYRHTSNFNIPTSQDRNRVQKGLDNYAKIQIEKGYWEVFTEEK